MLKGVLAAVIIILVGPIIGCSRYVDSRDPVRSLPDAGPIPINLTARLGNGFVTISWEVVDSADIALFRLYLADSTGAGYTLRDSTTGYSLTPGGLNVNERYYFKVAAVASSGLEGKLSEAVTARVTHLSIMIQSDREYTDSRDVQVQITCPPEETSHLMLSEDSTFADAVFVLFVSMETSFQLSEGDGVKTVYARLQFVDGTQSSILSDDIVLDTRVQPVYLYAVLQPDTTVLLGWTVSTEADFQSYRVFSDTQPGVDPSDNLISIINNHLTDSFIYSDPDPSITQRYYFKVYVYGHHGQMAPSNEVSVSF